MLKRRDFILGILCALPLVGARFKSIPNADSVRLQRILDNAKPGDTLNFKKYGAFHTNVPIRIRQSGHIKNLCIYGQHDGAVLDYTETYGSGRFSQSFPGGRLFNVFRATFNLR